jgi:excisionase family DNA binding protein
LRNVLAAPCKLVTMSDQGTNAQGEAWVNTLAVANHLGTSVFTVRRLLQSGAIPGVKIRNEWRCQLGAIDAHMTATPDPWAQSPRSRGRRRL